MPGLSFTKLVVGDLEKMADFYTAAFGLERFDRFQAGIAEAPIDEIMLGVGAGWGPGSLVLLCFEGQSPPSVGAVILGFVTDDLDALVERVRDAGGALHQEARDVPEQKVRVAFTTDPEGNLAELVQVQG